MLTPLLLDLPVGCRFNDLRLPEGASVDLKKSPDCKQNGFVNATTSCALLKKGFRCRPVKCLGDKSWARPFCRKDPNYKAKGLTVLGVKAHFTTPANEKDYKASMKQLNAALKRELATYSKKISHVKQENKQDDLRIQREQATQIAAIQKRASMLSVEHAEEITALTSDQIALGAPIVRAVTETIRARYAGNNAIAAAIDTLTAHRNQKVPDSVKLAAERVEKSTAHAQEMEKVTKALKNKLERKVLCESQLDELKLGIERAEEKRKKAGAEASLQFRRDQKRAKEQIDMHQKECSRMAYKKKEMSEKVAAQEKATKVADAQAKVKSIKLGKVTEAYPEVQFEGIPPRHVKAAVPQQDLSALAPKQTFHDPIQGLRPTFREAANNIVPLPMMKSVLIAGAAGKDVPNIPRDERNQCSLIFQERTQKKKAICSGKVLASGVKVDVTVACARSCAEAKSPPKDEDKTTKRKWQEAQVAKRVKADSIRASALEEVKKKKVIVKQKMSKLMRMSKSLKATKSQLKRAEASLKSLRSDLSSLDEEYKMILKLEAAKMLSDVTKEKIVGANSLKDHYELDFPIDVESKEAKSREQVHLPVRDEGLGRLMRYNTFSGGRRQSRLLFIDETTRVLYQIDVATGRTTQVVDFWKHGYVQKPGMGGTPWNQRLPCAHQVRAKQDPDQDLLTPEGYELKHRHRCLAMNPHVVASKRATFGSQSSVVYNDISETELGFAFTGVALPGVLPKGGSLEPHHNTWRIPHSKADDRMFFYAAQGLVTSSMKFGKKSNGWQRHNTARLELLEYEVGTPLSGMRTFTARGIPGFAPDFPGAEELDDLRSTDWTSPLGEEVSYRPDASYYTGHKAKVTTYLKEQLWDQHLLKKTMSCGAESKPQPWHVIQAQHDCTNPDVFDKFSEFKYPTHFADCKAIINPEKQDQKRCKDRPEKLTVYKAADGQDRRVSRAKESVSAKGQPLASVCKLSCAEFDAIKEFGQQAMSVADAVRKKRLLEMVMKRDARRPTKEEQKEHDKHQVKIEEAGHVGRMLNKAFDEPRVAVEGSTKFGAQHQDSTKGRAAFDEYFRPQMETFFKCIRDEKQHAKVDVAERDEMGHLMGSNTWNREWLAPKDGTGKTLKSGAWKECSVQRQKLQPKQYLAAQTKVSEELGEAKAVVASKAKSKASAAEDAKVESANQASRDEQLRKKRRNILIADAVKKQEIAAMLAHERTKEVTIKTALFDEKYERKSEQLTTFFNCQVSAELRIASKCYTRMIQDVGDKRGKYFVNPKPGHYDHTRHNMAARPFTNDFVNAHKKCVAVRAEFRRFECQQLFADNGPGQQCRRDDDPLCAGTNSCGRQLLCDPDKKFPLKMEWVWEHGEGKVKTKAGKFDCGAVCGSDDPAIAKSVSLYSNLTFVSDTDSKDIPAQLVGFNPGARRMTGAKVWKAVQHMRAKLLLLDDIIKKVRKGLITGDLWVPFQPKNDARGLLTENDQTMDRLRRVTVLESVAVPDGRGAFTRQLWLAMSVNSVYKDSRASNADHAATWSGNGQGQCPPHGVETKLYVAEVPPFNSCASRCELFFRDAGFTPATPVAPNANATIFARNPAIFAKKYKAYAKLQQNWDKVNKLPNERVHDDSPQAAQKFATKTAQGKPMSGRRRCYTGPTASYRKTNVVAMTFDVVSAVEKHVYFMDACGRVLSAVVAGSLGKEQLIDQKELAGAKCRERALYGGASADGVGTDASFTPFYGRFYSGAGLSIYTDRLQNQKYMAVAEGWKGKLRSIRLGKTVPGAAPDSLGDGPAYKYSWNTKRAETKAAVVETLLPVIGPRKLAAGDDDHIFMVTTSAQVFDLDLRPRPSCLDLRKVFPRQMRENPKSWWKDHFAFDTWLPDRSDNSEATCETTDDCKGQDMAGRPKCLCPGGKIKTANFVCPKQKSFDRCAQESCKKMVGPECNSTRLSGDNKRTWAKAWWKELMNPAKINYHGEWEHFTPKTLTKSLRFCLAKELAPPKDPFQGLPASPERVQKQIAKEIDQRHEKMLELGEECGKKFGSWWGVTLVKKVQAVRHMCGPPSPISAGRPTSGKNCPIVFLHKMTRCIHQVGSTAKPVCCVDKTLSNYLTPKLEFGKVTLPVELRDDVANQLTEF